MVELNFMYLETDLLFPCCPKLLVLALLHELQRYRRLFLPDEQIQMSSSRLAGVVEEQPCNFDPKSSQERLAGAGQLQTEVRYMPLSA
jgi:hypothetical protein